MFNRKNVALAATVLGGLIVAALLVALISAIDFRHNTTGSAPPNRVEMMPENSPEFSRTHVRNVDGKDEKLLIAYRNGDSGVVIYRKDGTMSQFVVVFPDGTTPRKVSTFDPSGKVITEGFEVRLDGTKVWVTGRLPDGNIKTVTFWQDGTTVFSESVRFRTPGEPDQVETRYLRKDGTPLVRQVTGNYGGTSLREEDVYDAAGTLLYSRRTPDGVSGTVEYFRPDGTLSFRQTFETGYSGGRGGFGFGGEMGGYYSSTATLKTITIFAADGATPTMEIGLGYSKTLSTWDAKGVKTIRYLKWDGTAAARIEYVAVDGAVTSNNDPKGEDAKLPAYDSATVEKPMPAPLTPQAEWRAAEAATQAALEAVKPTP